MGRILRLRREARGFAIGSALFALGATPGYLGLVGTLFFNISTFAALFTHASVTEQLHHVWRPDVYGSICFLISAGLAVRATTHADRLWDPEVRGWWSAWLNLAGSVAFGVSAVFAYIDPATGQVLSTDWVNGGTFVGAVCFLAAALLVRPARPRPARGVD